MKDKIQDITCLVLVVFCTLERGAVVEIPSLAGTWPAADIYRLAWHLFLITIAVYVQPIDITPDIQTLRSFCKFLLVWSSKIPKNYPLPYIRTNSYQNPPKPFLQRYTTSRLQPIQGITTPREFFNMGKSPHVAIIGAGISGLRCADILGQNGAQVTIFEARDRVGGRVRPTNRPVVGPLVNGE